MQTDNLISIQCSLPTIVRQANSKNETEWRDVAGHRLIIHPN